MWQIFRFFAPFVTEFGPCLEGCSCKQLQWRSVACRTGALGSLYYCQIGGQRCSSNLVMYVSAADNDYVGVTGTFLGTPSQGVWSTARLDFSVPPGGIAKLHFGAFGGSIPGLVQQSAGTLDLYSMQIRASAFEGLRDGPAGRLAGPLTAQGNVGCDQLLCNDVNCTDVFTTGVDASGAVSCAALTATGAVAGATLTSTGAVSGSSLSISGAASVGLLSSATGITGSTLTINNTANAGNFTTVGDVSTGTRQAASMRSSARRSVAASAWLRAVQHRGQRNLRAPPGPNRFRQNCLALQQPHKARLNAVRWAQDGQGKEALASPLRLQRTRPRRRKLLKFFHFVPAKSSKAKPSQRFPFMSGRPLRRPWRSPSSPGCRTSP